MCTPASFVLTKDAVFWSKTSNSHEDIIAEHGLNADGVRGTNILRVEIVPADGDYGSQTKLWVYHTDQDILPPWCDAVADEKRTRAALRQWKKYHCCCQRGGYRSTQSAGDRSTQKAGLATVQITRWSSGGALRVAVRIIDASTADRWYFVQLGVWRECTPDEIAAAEKRINVKLLASQGGA
jgi:hypothetical protein